MLRFVLSNTIALAIGSSLLLSSAVYANENKSFKKPKINGNSLDYCLNWGKDCGKPAADAFCKLQGFAEAGVHAKWNNAGKTELIGTGQICNDKSCGSFNYIVCVSDKQGLDVEATTESDIGEVSDGAGGSDEDLAEAPDPGAENVLNKLGGRVFGEVSTARFNANGKDRIAVFGRGEGDTLRWMPGNGDGKWLGWRTVPDGTMKGSPSCDSHQGKVMCAVRGQDDAIWITSMVDPVKGTWNGFKSISGVTNGDPNLVVGRDGNSNPIVYVLVRTDNKELAYNAFVMDPETDLINWSGWYKTGRTLNASPSCYIQKDSKVFCIDRLAKTNKIIELPDVTGFNAGIVNDLKGETKNRPGFLYGHNSGKIYSLVRGLNGKLWTNIKMTNGKWAGWKETVYTFTGQPVCRDMLTAGKAWCFAVTEGGSVVAQNISINALSGK